MSSISSESTEPSAKLWQQGELIELTISDLNHSGEGVGRYEGRVVFVPDTVVGDRLLVRLVRVKRQYAYGKLHEILERSPHRIRPSCFVADKCGGCQWQHVSYAFQLETKRNLVIQDLERIGKFDQITVDPMLANAEPLGYRNKATYPLKRSSNKEHKSGLKGQGAGAKLPIPKPPSLDNDAFVEPATEKLEVSVLAGYYQKGSHQLINLNQCPIQDVRLNPLLAEVKQDIQRRGWSIYDETLHRGKLRHLGLRIGRHTGEMLLTLVSTHEQLLELDEQAQIWLDRYPGLVGVMVNVNSDRTNAIFGKETHCIAGRDYLVEEFAGLPFRVNATTFFQVNTEQAEALLQVIIEQLNFKGTEVLLDAYCGIGTLTLPLAQRVKSAIALEIQAEAVEQARLNARLNDITNVEFHTGDVETLLFTLEMQPDIVVLDPPRKGCSSIVLETLLKLRPQQIVYVSCNPSTLARDLKILCDAGDYTLRRVQPADFFPQTAHVECAAFLELSEDGTERSD